MEKRGERNQIEPQRGGIRCKDCRHGTRESEGIRCSANGGLYPLHPEMYCVDAREKEKR